MKALAKLALVALMIWGATQMKADPGVCMTACLNAFNACEANCGSPITNHTFSACMNQCGIDMEECQMVCNWQ